MAEPKQVILIRTDTTPKMRKGKMVAQGAHASMKVFFDRMWTDPIREGYIKSFAMDVDSPMDKWVNGIFTKAVVGATEEEMKKAYDEAFKQGIPCAMIIDKGLTEFNGVETLTSVAIGPDDPDKIDPITGHLKLL